MNIYEKMFISGIGATTPLFSKIFVDHFANAPERADSITNSIPIWVGLFLAGCFWAYVNNGNMTKLQIFQLGIALPSLIISSINANDLASESKISTSLSIQNNVYEDVISEKENMLQPDLLDESGEWMPPSNNEGESENPAFNDPFYQTIPKNILISEVRFASFNRIRQETDENNHSEQDTLKYKLKSFANTFDNIKLPWYGRNWSNSFAGANENKWFVIVGIHKNEQDAIKQRELINDYYSDIKAEVYEPYEGKEFYSVVIGERLTFIDAQKLKEHALIEELPKSTYLRAILGKLEQANLNME